MIWRPTNPSNSPCQSHPGHPWLAVRPQPISFIHTLDHLPPGPQMCRSFNAQAGWSKMRHVDTKAHTHTYIYIIYIYNIHICVCIYTYTLHYIFTFAFTFTLTYMSICIDQSKWEKKRSQSQQPSAGLRGQRSQAFSTLADEDLVLALWGRQAIGPDLRQLGSCQSLPHCWAKIDKYIIIYTGWCPPVITWFINPINYSYICHKP